MFRVVLGVLFRCVLSYELRAMKREKFPACEEMFVRFKFTSGIKL